MGAAAIDLLRGNDNGRFIVPSRRQYPHLWLWDACFHAIVLAHLRPDLASREIEATLSGQWEDGRVPHVVFGPGIGRARYRPGPSDWATGRPTSGITQCPLLATASAIVFRKTGDRGFLARVYAPIRRYHEWLKRTRDPDGSGLLALIHPWESGTDNSPVFDRARRAFLRSAGRVAAPPRADTRAVDPAQRPRDEDYRFYWGLIDRFKAAGWGARSMYQDSPLRIADVLFNSIWARANDDLACMAWELGRQGEARCLLREVGRSKRAIRSRLWDGREGFFYPLDLRTGRRIRIRTSSGFAPLWAGVPTPAEAAALADRLKDRGDFGSEAGVPSVSFREPAFEAERYWRGPVWINMHWLLAHGFARYGRFDLAALLAERSRALVKREGYREYYHPLTGKGLGAPGFAWSTLAHTLPPRPAPPELRRKVLVMPAERASRHPELKTIYRHPRLRPRSPRRVTSSPSEVAREAVGETRALLRRRRRARAPTPAELRALALELRGALQKARGLTAAYPRFCDVSSLAAETLLAGMGLGPRIMWSPFIHYFASFRGPDGGRWIFDLCPDQFASHPMSRLPLLLERATLELAGGRPSPLRQAGALEETRLSVELNLRSGGLVRPDKHEREALAHAIERHERMARRAVAGLPAPLRGPVAGYPAWVRGLRRRLLEPGPADLAGLRKEAP